MSSVQRPDVVIVVLGGVRALDCSAVREDAGGTTPRLAALAAEGLVFEEATSTSPWALPAQASILTGLMPSRHGAHERSGALAAGGPPTLAEVLGEGGYHTVLAAADGAVAAPTGLQRGFAQVVAAGAGDSEPRRAAAPPPAGGRFGFLRRRQAGDAAVLGHADGGGVGSERAHAGSAPVIAAAVDTALRQAADGHPLHLHVALGGARLPLQPADAAVRPDLDSDAELATARGLDQSPLHHLTGASLHTEREWRLLRALYRGAVREADAQLGSVLDALRAAGRLDGTLVVVVADHGMNIGEHGLLGEHHSLNDTVLRVPLVVRPPGATRRGVEAGLAQHVDIMATVCDVAGIAAPATQGESLLGQRRREHSVAEYLAPHPQLGEWMRSHAHVDWSPYDRGLRSLRTAGRKYVAASDGGNELYDLAADPDELDNRYGRGHPDELRLARALRRWELEEGAQPLGGVVADAAVSERLRALGYIE